MSDILYQAYIPVEAQVAIKVFCAKQTIKNADTYKMRHFVEDVLKFIRDNDITEFLPAVVELGGGIVAFNMRVSEKLSATVKKCKEKVSKAAGEDISIRRMLSTGVLLYLKHNRAYSAPQLKGICV